MVRQADEVAISGRDTRSCPKATFTPNSFCLLQNELFFEEEGTNHNFLTTDYWKIPWLFMFGLKLQFFSQNFIVLPRAVFPSKEKCEFNTDANWYLYAYLHQENLNCYR